MTLMQIYDAVKGHNALIGIAVVLLLSCVEVSKIKLNPWSWLFGKIGALCNRSITENLNNLTAEVSQLRKDLNEEKAEAGKSRAIEARSKILWFGDELRNGVRHSQDNFRNIFAACELYEQYCATHPTFENGITSPTIKFIRHKYDECLEYNDFL